MTLNRLSIHNLRNLNAVDIDLSHRVNLIYGENGSGKTSILEAINLLALGRSFRSHKHKHLINNDRLDFTVFGRIKAENGADVPIGINRHRNGTACFKANGNSVSSAADLALYLPLQVMNADTFSLLEGGPSVRRQFIDWLVFHVEPGFFKLWRDCQRCLKHRNSLLRRDRMPTFPADLRAELNPWDRELTVLTEQIHQLRSKCMDQFTPVFYGLLTEFLSVEGIAIEYFCGWDITSGYEQTLAISVPRDLQLGYTNSGSHRADLRITVNKHDASEILSRGQQKLLVCALKIAQGIVYSRLTGRKTIYLVDDLPAELDDKHRKLLAHWLDEMSTQVFVTGVNKDSLLSIWLDKPAAAVKLFHVEQGKVTEIVKPLVELTASLLE